MPILIGVSADILDKVLRDIEAELDLHCAIARKTAYFLKENRLGIRRTAAYSISMKKRFALCLSLSFVLASSSAFSNLTFKEAYGRVATQFGPDAVNVMAEAYAFGGTPQPRAWKFLAHDARAPRMLYQFQASEMGAFDGGTDQERYPDRVPAGFFRMTDVQVDSKAAFAIAESEARRAKVAFDSVDYVLRARDFNTGAYWRLDLMNRAQRTVGKLYISADSGQVLRSVWVFRDQRSRPDGLPKIEDSLLIPESFTRSLVPNPPGAAPEVGIAPPVNPPVLRAPVSPNRISPPMPIPRTGPATDDGIPEAPVAPSPSKEAKPSSQMRDLREVPKVPKSAPSQEEKKAAPPEPGKAEPIRRIPPPPIPN